MSIPITSCMISRAARGDEKAFQELFAATYHNRVHNFGIYTHFSCECDPRCPQPTPVESAALNHRMLAELDAAFARRDLKTWHDTPIAETIIKRPAHFGTFDKWIFPVIKRPSWWRRVWNKLTGKKTWLDADLREILKTNQR
jgi:hypothetical protein